MSKTSQDATVDLKTGSTVFAIDYLLFLTEKIYKTPPRDWPVKVKCTDRDMIINTIPELKILEREGKIKVEQIGGYQEKLI